MARLVRLRKRLMVIELDLLTRIFSLYGHKERSYFATT